MPKLQFQIRNFTIHTVGKKFAKLADVVQTRMGVYSPRDRDSAEAVEHIADLSDIDLMEHDRKVNTFLESKVGPSQLIKISTTPYPKMIYTTITYKEPLAQEITERSDDELIERMSGLCKAVDLIGLETYLSRLTESWLTEGFDQEDIDTFLIKFNKS